MNAPTPIAGNQGAIAWLKENLFSSKLNAVLTIVILAALGLVLPKLISWGLTNAVFAPDPAACRAAKGACWGFVVEKYRLMTFGTYPFDQQWRPLLVMIVLLSLIGATMTMRAWTRRLWISWAIGVPMMWVLMRGGSINVSLRAMLIIGALAASGVMVWRGRLPTGIHKLTAFAAIVLLFIVTRWLPLMGVSLPTGLPLVETDKWGGLPLTLILSANGIVLSFPLAILLALGRRSDLPVIRALSVGYIEIVRGVPLITVLFMASLMIPLFLPEGMSPDKLLRAQIGFILFAAAYEAEVIRGGLQALPKGQYEAADALGLSYWQKMGLVVLPQALKVVIPPMVNTFIGFFKDTSLVIIIGLFDLLGAVRLASSDVEWRIFYVEGLVFVGLVYFAFCYAMASYARRLEQRLNTDNQR